MALRGVTDLLLAGPNEDYDSDGESNIVELLYGTNPTDDGDFTGLSADQIFVAKLLIAGIGPKLFSRLLMYIFSHRLRQSIGQGF